ncbi:probable disease resistance protein At4g27220 [Prunus avium]|uniref:Probable disease resistance protein At4g27220 n=1 Tax=Prunus avium TaxID=42229 RepID=A0A6P5T9G8_PRUAV|nr:probable disease resistance protein At4g27220 [Prunus avium]
MDILPSIISIIMEYTVKPVGRQVGYLIHYKSNLKNLRSKWENFDAAKDSMKHMVDEGERKGKRVRTDVKKWLTEANEMIQEAKKLLDDEDHAKTKCFRGVCPNLVSYHQVSRKSAKLTEKIELHDDQKEKFTIVCYNPPLEEICAMPSQNYMPFESRISMVKEIMKELKNPDTNMIGVYGLGGVGKTTLSQEVYRQATKENLFDEVVIVLDVKKYPDLEKKERIQKTIAEKLGMDVDETQDMEARAKHLWNRIKDNNIFVILDDVWEAIDLEALGLRPMATCKILLTSRNRVSEMNMEKEFRLEVLSVEENWSLFEKMVGDVVKDDRIHEVATEIAKKCGGLPVSVVAVARSLRSATTLEEWRVALRDFKSIDEQGLTESAYLTLEWSYNRLDANELKPLFLLCGIIAGGGCTISLSDLLKYAMGLSLVKNVDTVEEARDKLISLAKKLIKDYCLLLGIDDDGDIRMHELVRDVAMVIASKDNHAIAKAYGDELKEWPDRNSLKKCTPISLKSCKIPRLPKVPWVCPELRIFHLENHNIDDSLEIPGNYFEGMKELKVLDVTRLRIPSVPPSLQSLTNLQTLCLDQCVLGDIALVGQLPNLKILSLIHSQVKELPKEIGQLTHLQLLDLTDCSELVLIPAGVISSLTSLEDLRMGSFKEWEGGLNDGRSNASASELKQLRQLTALEIRIPDAKLLPANMFSDTKLERYTILIGDCWLYPKNYRTSSNKLKLKLTTNSQFDQGIKLLLKRCEHLDLDGVEAANMIFYILASDSGKQLKNLHVQNNDVVTSLINSSHAFPNLESLSLYNLVNLETVCCGQLIAQPFQKLRYLTLRNLPKLIGFSSKGSTSVVSTEAEEIILENEIGGPTKVFMNGEVLIPNLTRLILNQCDGLRFLFSCSMARRLEQLEHLEISTCQMMEEIVSATYDTSTTQLKTFECPNLDFVEIDACERLINIFPASVANSLEQLTKLSVENCAFLEEIVAKEGVEMTPTEEFVFPNVTFVHFEHLPQMRSFYPGLHVSKWPLLKELRFDQCGKVEIFASEYSRFQKILNSGASIIQPFLLVDKGNPFPNLKVLDLDENTKIWNEAHGPLPAELFINLKEIVFSCAHPQSFHFLEKLRNLEELHVYNGPWKEIFVYEGTCSGEIDAVGRTLPHVKNLCLDQMEELMHLGNDTSESIFPNLEILKVYRCAKLKNVTSSAISFRNLTTLDVWRCGGLKYLTTYSVAKCLQQLKILEVEYCESMIEIVASNEDEQDSGNYYEIAFSSLQHLKLYDLPILQGFCSSEIFTIRVPSLNSLIVEKCLIELKISPDKSLIQSSSRPERLQITEEVEEEKEKEEDDDGNETGGKQLIAHTS